MGRKRITTVPGRICMKSTTFKEARREIDVLLTQSETRVRCRTKTTCYVYAQNAAGNWERTAFNQKGTVKNIITLGKLPRDLERYLEIVRG